MSIVPHDSRRSIAHCTDAARAPLGLLADAHARAQRDAARRTEHAQTEAPRAEPTARSASTSQRAAAPPSPPRAALRSWPTPIGAIATSVVGLAIARWFHLLIERASSGQ